MLPSRVSVCKTPGRKCKDLAMSGFSSVIMILMFKLPALRKMVFSKNVPNRDGKLEQEHEI